MKNNYFLMKLIVIPIVFLCLGASGNFDYGKITNHKYRNSYFGFTATIPKTWFVQTKEQTREIMSRGKSVIAGDDQNMKALLNASEINSANLLTVFKYETGSAVEFNPSLSIVAENVKNFPGIKSGKDYLFQTRKLLKLSQLKYDHLDEVFATANIGEKEFHRMNAVIKVLGNTVKQEYYSMVMKGFSFNIIVTYVTEKEKEELYGILNTMIFK